MHLKPRDSTFALALIASMLTSCSGRQTSIPSASPNQLQEVLDRGDRLNWYVRVQRSDSTWVDGRIRGAGVTTLRVGDSIIEPAEIALVLRRDDAPSLRDWKPFAAAIGVGGLAGLFAGFLTKAALSDDAYTGSESARWFVGGSVVGLVGLLAFSGDASDTNWVQEWPPIRD